MQFKRCIVYVNLKVFVSILYIRKAFLGSENLADVLVRPAWKLVIIYCVV